MKQNKRTSSPHVREAALRHRGQPGLFSHLSESPLTDEIREDIADLLGIEKTTKRKRDAAFAELGSAIDRYSGYVDARRELRPKKDQVRDLEKVARTLAKLLEQLPDPRSRFVEPDEGPQVSGDEDRQDTGNVSPSEASDEGPQDRSERALDGDTRTILHAQLKRLGVENTVGLAPKFLDEFRYDAEVVSRAIKSILRDVNEGSGESDRFGSVPKPGRKRPFELDELVEELDAIWFGCRGSHLGQHTKGLRTSKGVYATPDHFVPTVARLVDPDVSTESVRTALKEFGRTKSDPDKE